MNNTNLVYTNGLTFTLNSAASVNNTLLKASPTTVVTLLACNNAITAAFIKIFDKQTAPVAGVDIPVMTITVPAGSQVLINVPIQLSVGLGVAITNLVADADATAVVSGQVKLKLVYTQ